MKHFTRNIYFILISMILLLPGHETYGKEKKVDYSQNSISNYFSGIISADQDFTDKAFKYLNKVQFLKNSHSNFNVQFVYTLILLGKFEQAFTFSKEIWNEEEFFFESELLLGLESFVNDDYLEAEKYFRRLNEISEFNLLFEDFLGNTLLAWNEASKNNKDNSFKFLNKIPDRYENLKQIQNSFLKCYFDSFDTEQAFEQLINSQDSGFSRYNFFLANYLLFKNKNSKAEKIIKINREAQNSNLLIKQAENHILNGNTTKIKKYFNCKNPKDVIAETFYVIANLYSTQKNYQLSNFYMKISLFLNDKFTPNKILLAENFFNQQKYEIAKKNYKSIKSIGSIYSWYASVKLAAIFSETKSKDYSTSYLEKEFNLLNKPDFENCYELANFFKENEYYKKSIKYYSLALKKIKKGHFLIPKILDRRGTSYERLGDWFAAEKDLMESLRISPDQAHVLNYLAYSWLEKRTNINKALEMLKRAHKMRENDGYIIDSLGWAYYVNKNYVDADKFLQRAVEIMPLDPVINDHYADTLWMLNKKIQARYFWKYVLNLDTAEQKLKDKISRKLIFGVEKKL